jgi:hypothetical protein
MEGWPTNRELSPSSSQKVSYRNIDPDVPQHLTVFLIERTEVVTEVADEQQIACVPM